MDMKNNKIPKHASHAKVNPETTNPMKPVNLEYKQQKPKNPKNKNRKKIIIITCIVAFLLLVGTSIAIAANIILNTSFESEENIKAKGQLVETTFNEPFYMVLVGTDTREDGKKSYQLTEGRSDTCLLARIDPVKYQITLLSIPRDTKIQINGGTEKFNAAYNYGGVSSTIEQVKKLCKVDVSHYAEVSFNGLVDLVDAVGGVEVDVKEPVDDINVDVQVPAGKQVLNGEQALSFARTRQFADGDFTRTEDQRTLIKALIDKAFKMDIGDIPNVVKAAKKFIKTDLTLGDMVGLATKFRDNNQVTVYSAMVPSTTGTIGDASYCFTDTEALNRMMKMIENGEDPSMIQITSGASIGSAKTSADLLAKQEEYYKQHPNSPGKASSSSATETPTTNSNSNSDY